MTPATPPERRPSEPGLAPSRPKHTFGHSDQQVAFWRGWAAEAVRKGARSPFYLFSPSPVADQLRVLDALDFGRPTRHWFSCKTQPLEPQLTWWKESGRGAEVVSGTEYAMVRRLGFDEDQILLNGPAKHRWLAEVSRPGMRVHFDSPSELAALLPLARQHRWRCGIRVRPPEEFDPGAPRYPTQFGFEPDEAVRAYKKIRSAGVAVESLHFHLRTNLPDVSCHARALSTMAEVCQAARWQPRFLDIGGGLPPAHIRGKSGKYFDGSFRLTAWAALIRRTWDTLPQVEELWLENGRFLLATSGVLCVQVLDVKRRAGLRQLIADGGRTLHALISTWEDHELLPLESARRGREVPTAVYGPTCMAFDQLAIRPMTSSIRAGDRLLWFEAGAYHLPWETRFSHGLAEIWWQEGNQVSCCREGEAPVRSFTDRRIPFDNPHPRDKLPVKSS